MANFSPSGIIKALETCHNFLDCFSIVLTNLQVRKNKIDVNLFWFVCLNNPRFAVGNKILPIENKCKISYQIAGYSSLELSLF